MKLFILTILSLLSVAVSAGTLATLEGTYQADEFQIEVLDNGKIKLSSESLFGPHSGVEKSVQEKGDSGVFGVEGLPHIIILTGSQVEGANCPEDNSQDIAVAAMGASGVEIYCLKKDINISKNSHKE